MTDPVELLVAGRTARQHVAWAIERALPYADTGDAAAALASMQADLGKHPGTVDHGGLVLGLVLTLGGQIDTPHQIREWVEGFR